MRAEALLLLLTHGMDFAVTLRTCFGRALGDPIRDLVRALILRRKNTSELEACALTRLRASASTNDSRELNESVKMANSLRYPASLRHSCVEQARFDRSIPLFRPSLSVVTLQVDKVKVLSSPSRLTMLPSPYLRMESLGFLIAWRLRCISSMSRVRCDRLSPAKGQRINQRSGSRHSVCEAISADCNVFC